MTVVDCQWHWYPRGFFDAQLDRQRFPRARRHGAGYVLEFAPGAELAIGPPHCDLDVQLGIMDEAGIDIVVGSPASVGVDMYEADEARELAMLLNETYADAHRISQGRFLGLATLPLQDAAASIDILDDAIGRLGLAGVFLHSNVRGEPLDAPRLRPVLRRVAELGVPVFLHPTRTIFADVLDRHGLEFVVGFPFDTTVAALSLVFGGVLDELPDLRIVHPHLGATIPFLAGRIDFEYEQPWAMGRALDRAPTEYLRQFYVDTVSRNPGALALARDFYGIDRILLGTDHPWWPASEGVMLCRRELRAGDAELVLGANALALLRGG